MGDGRRDEDLTRTHLDGAAAEPGPVDERIPERVGHYRVLRPIGHGGMGTVYEAEQESPRRTVALKLIRPGAASANATKRFAYEAQVLGRLQHPGIGQIFEAGTAEVHGHEQPFFAMELIRGRPLDEHVAEAGLDTAARLELLARICDAVQYAHQQGVVHRDLKPGNILIDEDGNPKILDFGLARLTDADVQLTTMGTEVGAIVGTVAYMSPEQAAGRPQDVDTRSDVYSLGVIGYQLLAGRMPYAIEGKMIHQAVSTILDEDPSTLASVSRTYRGDLDTIFAKALEKSKERRYGSAAELAADIRRYLSDEPILARPPSTAYQLRKFARRHKPLVAGIATGVAALIIGLVGTIYGLLQANRARDAAQLEARKAEAINEFLLKDMLQAPDPGVDGRDVTVASILDRASEQVGPAFAEQPEIEAEVRSTLGRTYKSLGLLDSAEEHIVRALELRRALRGEEDLATVSALFDLGGLQMERDRFDEAYDTNSRVLEIRRRKLGEEHPDTLQAMTVVGSALFRRGDYQASLELLSEVLETRRRLLGDDDPQTLESLTAVGWVYQRVGRIEESKAIFSEASERLRELSGEDHPDTIKALNGLAATHSVMWELDEAEAIYRETLAASRRVFGERHHDTSAAVIGLANVFASQRRHDDALPLYREALEIYRQGLGEDHQYTMVAVNNVAVALARTGQAEEADAMHRANLERRRRILGEAHSDVGQSLEALAITSRILDKHDLAVDFYRQALEVYRAAFGGSESPEVTNVLSNLAFALREMGDQAGAVEVLKELIPLEQAVQGEDHRYVQDDLRALTLALLDLGRHQQAEESAREMLRLVESNHGDKPHRVELARGLVGECLMEQERFAEAEEWIVGSHDALHEIETADDDDRDEARRRALTLYRRWGKPQKEEAYR